MRKTRRIVRRLDAALAKMAERKMEPRAIYLTRPDYDALARARTRRYRQDTGSPAFVWPLSHEDVPIISASLIQHMIPIRETKSAAKQSMIYSKHGVAVHVPRIVELP
jgi:hypothetical protein